MRPTIHSQSKYPFYLFSSVFFALCLAGFNNSYAETNPRLIKDVNTLEINADSLCGQPVSVNGIAYFCGAKHKLWRSDGTAAGTLPVIDSEGNEISFPSNLISSLGLLFYEQGSSLWVTDGTANGTRALVDNEDREINRPTLLTEFNGELYFFRFNLTRNGSLTFLHELWKTDGQTTELVSLFNTRLNPNDMVTVGGLLYFTNYDHELWKSDGTQAGTQLIATLPGKNYFEDHNNLTNVDGTLYFTLEDDSNNHYLSLWTSNGTTAGTVLVVPSEALPKKIDLLSFTDSNGAFYFTSEDNLPDLTVWRSDGTEAGTNQIASLPNSRYFHTIEFNNALYLFSSSGVWKLNSTDIAQFFESDAYSGYDAPAVHDNTLFFSADDGQGHGRELWKTNGTPAGTAMVKDIAWLAKSSNPTFLTSIDTGLLFQANKADHLGGNTLWISKGAPTNTQQLIDISQFTESSSPAFLTEVNGIAYFLANKARSPTGNYQQWELWKTNGTEAGTQLVFNLIPERTSNGGKLGNEYGELISFNNHLYFTGNDGTGWSLFKTDGTPSGTLALSNLLPSYVTGEITGLSVIEGNLLFFADTGVEIGLWKLMPNEMTATPVSLGLTQAKKLATINNVLYFSNNHDELWSSTGDDAETGLIMPMLLGDDVVMDKVMVLDDHSFIFRASWNLHYEGFRQNSAFWFSDGTATGTNQLLNYYPSEVVVLGNTIIFANETGGLWASDGTTNGTVKLTDERGLRLTKVGDAVYFSVEFQYLWRTDGTVAGTTQILDDVDIVSMAEVNNQLYFSAIEVIPNSGRVPRFLYLMKTDGTKAGTVKLKPDLIISHSLQLDPDNTFIAFSSYSNHQIWQSDGTNEGTVKISDHFINRATVGFGFADPLIIGKNLYYPVNDGIKGAELWLYDFSDPNSPEGTSQIGNYVWRDVNADGIQDDDELGLSDVTVNLWLDCKSDNKLTTITGQDGAFLFDNLPAGNYQLEFVKPNGYSFSPSIAAGDYTRDSNANPLNGLDVCRSLYESQRRLGLDAGLIPDTSSNVDTLTVEAAIFFTSDNTIWVKVESDALPTGSSVITATAVTNGVERNLGQVHWRANKNAYQTKFRNLPQVPEMIIVESDLGGIATAVVEVQ